MLKKTYGFKLKGEKDYLRELTFNPDNVHTLLRLADIYVRKKKIEKALEAYKSAADKLVLVGKTHGANAIYKLIYKINPQWGNIAEIVKGSGDTALKAELKEFRLEDIKNFVAKVELFQGLSDKEIDSICSTVNIRKFFPGDVIIKQGEEGDSIFIVLQGSVRVYFDDEIGKVVELAYLTQGDFFGEMGFMGSKKRRASVASIDESVLLELSKEKVDKLIEAYPEIEKTLLKYYHERILDLVIATTPVFSPLEANVRKELVSKFKLKKFPAGTTIIKEGDVSDSMYVIKSGTVKVCKIKEGVVADIAKLEASDFFGEIGLITGQKRTADIIAETDVELMELDKKDIDFIITRYPEILNLLRDYIKDRTSDTFSKLMELKRLSSKKGLV
jgi:cAMP-dependent protein kinase regulator